MKARGRDSDLYVCTRTTQSQLFILAKLPILYLIGFGDIFNTGLYIHKIVNNFLKQSQNRLKFGTFKLKSFLHGI